MARPALRLVVMSGLVAAFFGQSMVQLAAGLAKEDFGVEGRGFGLLAAVYGLGAVFSSLLLVAGAERVRRSRTVVFGLSLFATGIIITVATRSLAVGIVGFLVAGTAHSLTGVSLNTSMQAQVDEEYRGRALSMFLMALLAGMPFGALVGGLLGDHVGLRGALLSYAIALIVYVVVAVTRFRGLGVLDADHVQRPELLDETANATTSTTSVRPAGAT
jgi:predicted MFS family arabinose efflux permease